jgi:D-alanine-D-alanine ligase
MLDYCTDIALRSWQALNCLDGGRVDVRFDREGNLNFIEVNPLAGLNPVISDLPILCKLNGMDYQTLIADILESAIQRNKLI